MTVSRDGQVARAMLSITDHLVSGNDVVDLLSELASSAVRLLGADACGVLLADEAGRLHVVAASSDSAQTLEMLQLQRDEGPCLDAFSSGRPVGVPDLPARAQTWPAFAAAASGLGFRSVHAFPVRLRGQALGVFGLFDTTTGSMAADDLEVADALGHIAGIALVAQRVAADQRQLTEQLQHALESRVVIEQCKGLLAAEGDLHMDQAFRALRKYARDHNRGITDVATAVVDRQLSPRRLLDHTKR